MDLILVDPRCADDFVVVRATEAGEVHLLPYGGGWTFQDMIRFVRNEKRGTKRFSASRDAQSFARGLAKSLQNRGTSLGRLSLLEEEAATFWLASRQYIR